MNNESAVLLRVMQRNTKKFREMQRSAYMGEIAFFASLTAVFRHLRAFTLFCREHVLIAIYAFCVNFWSLKLRSRNFFDKYNI